LPAGRLDATLDLFVSSRTLTTRTVEQSEPERMGPKALY
jgi:hypothetical protein